MYKAGFGFSKVHFHTVAGGENITVLDLDFFTLVKFHCTSEILHSVAVCVKCNEKLKCLLVVYYR